MKEEIWKDIEGFDGLYQVSNLGRVKSLDRYVRQHTGNQFKKGKILKQKNDKYGYKRIGLRKDGKQKSFQIHRLVAQTFIQNPHNYPCVNHKDEDKTNNCADNLEFCTVAYNNNYGTRNKIVSQKMTNHKSVSKCVIQFTKDGIFVNEYQSAREASRQTGICFSNISACCNNKPHVKSAGGYVWKFKEKSEA